MKCIHCNHNLPDDSEFCQYCGRKVDLVPDVIAEEPNLEGMSSDDAINAILKIHARNTIETMKANQNSQGNNEDDADFGLVPEKPIFTLALKSVDGEKKYLNRLYTADGEKIKYNRRGSMSIEGVNGIIDIYDTFLLSGQLYKTIYINMYGAKESTKAPAGFVLKSASKKVKSARKERPKQRNKVDSARKKEIKVKKPISQKVKRTMAFVSVSAVAVAIFVVLVFSVIIPAIKYNHAQELLELGKYDLAYTAFSELGNYSDAEDKLLEVRYLQAVDYRKNGDYDIANKIFETLGDYRDSKSLIHNHDYTISASTPKTCTVDGSETHTCASCGHSYVTAIKAEHTYTLVKDTPSTCSSAGEKKYTCSACNHSYTDTVAVKSHSFKSATCTAPKTCSDCGKTEGSALGHSSSIICSRCGAKTFEKLSYTGTGSKVIDYTLPRGKFRVTVTATSGEAIVSAKIYHGSSYEYLNIYDAGNSEIETIAGPVTGGTIVVNADDDYFGKSSWKITIEALEN